MFSGTKEHLHQIFDLTPFALIPPDTMFLYSGHSYELNELSQVTWGQELAEILPFKVWFWSFLNDEFTNLHDLCLIKIYLENGPIDFDEILGVVQGRNIWWLKQW